MIEISKPEKQNGSVFVLAVFLAYNTLLYILSQIKQKIKKKTIITNSLPQTSFSESNVRINMRDIRMHKQCIKCIFSKKTEKSRKYGWYINNVEIIRV
jgi:hypothetical protein